MTITPRRRLRRSGAGVTVGALVASGLLMASPAQAASTTLSELDVNLNYTRAAGSNTFLADGVRVQTVGTTSQSKAAGYFDTEIPLADSGTPSLDWSGTSPQPGKQLVVDFDGDGDTDGILVGEPVYGANWWLPGSTLQGSPVAQSIKDAAPKVGGGGSADNGPLSDWRTAFPDAVIRQAGWSLGSGIEGEGTIFGISVGDEEFYFSKAEVGATTLRRSDVSPRDTRSQGRNTFRPTGGVRIFTLDSSSNAKATGYFRIAEPLSDVGEPVWDVRLTESIEPGKQLVIDLDGDNATTNDRGILVGEPVYGKNWWLTGGSSQLIRDIAPATGGGNGSNWFGTLNQWRLAAPDATVLEAGWSLGSGVRGDLVLSEFRVGQTVYTFAGNRAPSADDVTGSIREGDDAVTIPLAGSDPDTDTYTDIAGVSAIADTLTYTVDGADGEVTVDGASLVYENDDVAADFDDEFTYTVTDDRGRSATAAVSVDVTANQAPSAADVDASTRTGDAVDIALSSTDPEGDDVTIVAADDADHGTVTQDGDTATYTPDEDYTGADEFTYTATDDRGASSTGTVTVTVAANRAPVAFDTTSGVKVGSSVAVGVDATDADGDSLTYAVAGTPANGTVVANGSQLTFTPAAGYSGTTSFDFTVSDGRGGSDTGTVTVVVSKYASTTTIKSIYPVAPTARSTIYAYVKVTAPGAPAVAGSTVTVKYGSKVVGTGVLGAGGTVNVKINRTLPKGAARTLKASFPSSATTAASSGSITFAVKK
ncbi:Ig-like domain-containing protein [Aeromicrobium stalagmiti]|uniref:Ig-like domain-containing protein n=1 Tax=Aeromicrobium stalagmiti TaxID=2738988 RepID=UPI001568651B|nr:Ig-like domain-containing protein [Aeromicrobium stalagmiti]NRQ49411.1 tandem-95 repeat protein [Aeromicrobium stalagmiti]